MDSCKLINSILQASPAGYFLKAPLKHLFMRESNTCRPKLRKRMTDFVHLSHVLVLIDMSNVVVAITLIIKEMLTTPIFTGNKTRVFFADHCMVQ
jgi:hypothetical protein